MLHIKEYGEVVCERQAASLYSKGRVMESIKEEYRKVEEIPLELIDPFPDHPFQVNDDDDMMELTESVRERGILNPAVLRQKEAGRYELLSGHRRKRAAELAGLTTLKAEVVQVNDEEAVIIMCDSNLQRTNILPSEKAKVYKMRLEAMKHQGKRTDLTSDPMGPKTTGVPSSKKLAEEVGDSRTQVQRYIRLNDLVPELLDMVDEGKMGLRPAVELSYLSEEKQRDLVEQIDLEQCTPSLSQAMRLRKMDAEDELTASSIRSVMLEDKPNQRTPEVLVLRDHRIFESLPKNLPLSKREEFICKAVRFYSRHLELKELDRETR